MKQESSSRSSVLRFVRALRAGGPRIALSAALGLLPVLVLGVLMVSAAPEGPAAPVGTADPLLPAGSATGQVIVQFDDTELVARRITFTAPISGLQALELSGLEVVTADSGFGPAVCSIGGVGCPADDCFCGGDVFWGYKKWEGDAWQDYPVGPGASSLDDGAVEGWRWGEWGGAMWPAPPAQAALKALDWLRPRQSPTDGGFGGDSASLEALLAAGGNGEMARDWRREPASPSLAGYWVRRAAPYGSFGAAQSGKLAVGLIGAEACWPRSCRQPGAYYSQASGSYDSGAGPEAWAILGTAALSQPVPVAAIQHLKGLARSNGGWEFGPGWGADTNTTALAIQALTATGAAPASAEIAQGLAYLKSAQNADGGFPYDPESAWGTDSDADSTAYVLQALRAAGQDPAGDDWRVGGNTPVSFLLSLQLSDGSFEWQPGAGSNQLSTQQAAVALLGRPLPLRVAEAEWCPMTYLPAAIRQ